MNRIFSATLAVLFCLGLCVNVVRGEDVLWQTNFEAAKAKAKDEKKYLLVDFTGSDWCGFCMKLKREVLDSELFANKASQKFVFVELDYPNKPLPEELKAQNEKLKQQYKIGGFPTICVMDSEGQLIARLVGYHGGGPEKYVEVLGALCKTWESVWKMRDELSGAKGTERTKLLDRLAVAYAKLSNPMDYF